MSGSTDGPSRRGVLATAGTIAGSTAFAGCSGLWSQPGATDVVAHNVGSERRVVSVVVTRSGADEPHTARTIDLDPAETVDPVTDGKLPTNDGYSVRVAVEGGPEETFEWSDPDLELAPLHVLVDDGENVTFLLQAG